MLRLGHDVHMNVSELRARMISNVYALLGIHRMSKTDLARALGWDGATITRLLNEDPKKASREWKIADIIEVGNVFELDDPFLLTRPLNEVVRGWDPNLKATGTGDTRGSTSAYVSTDKAFQLIQFPQVTADGPLLDRPATITQLASRRPQTSLPVAV